MQLVRYNMQEYGLSYEAAGAAAMQTLWQNALYEGYAGAFAGGVSAVIATPFGLRRALKNTVDTMSNSSDISPQKQDLLKAMDEDMNENSIGIDVSAGDASFRGEDGTATIISDDMADTGTQDTEDASVLSDGRISPPSDQDIINSIQGNIKNPDSAETMQTDLITGMSALIDIETRLKSDSGNINSKSIDISASHNAYMDFNTERGTIADSPAKLAKLGEAAQVMARDIQMAVETGRLTGTEVNQLLGVLTGLTGDADLAAAYIGIGLHDIGARATDIGKSATDIGRMAAEASVDSMQGAGDNGIGSGARNERILIKIRLIEFYQHEREKGLIHLLISIKIILISI